MHYTEDQLAAFEKAIAMFKADMNELFFNAWFSRLKGWRFYIRLSAG